MQLQHGIPVFALRASARRAIFICRRRREETLIFSGLTRITSKVRVSFPRLLPVFSGISVEETHAGLPNRSRGRATLMPVHFKVPGARCEVSGRANDASHLTPDPSHLAPLFYATRNPGAGQDFTGLAAAVQLRLRAVSGLQALQRCSGLLNRRARGSTVATHHLA
jgi:hypothetical protein